ncbi:MAG: RNA polymerase sigma factor SigF [Halothece sp.]
MASLTTGKVKQNSLELLRSYQNNPNQQVRNQIVELNMGLVRKEAHHWVTQCGENYDDLIQVGCIGLIRAIERFELSKGNAFSSFAMPYIRGEIQHYLRDRSTSVKIPRRWLELKQQASKVTYRLREELKRQPTEAEIAEKLNVSLEEWQEIKLAAKNREPLSLDVPMGSEDEKTPLGELVPDDQYRSFQLAQEDRIRLQQGLIELEERTRSVLEFVFLQDLTQKEAAEVLGVSVVTVSRRLKKGLKLLKNQLS